LTLFDAEHLYLGIKCCDRTPSAIVSTQLARDADMDVDDRVLIVLDPLLDHRNGFLFMVNPAGARADGQISKNSEDLSFEWDGIWDARARLAAAEWEAGIGLRCRT